MSRSLVTRLRITIQGIVQGVGFRPFIYRLAKELNLKGWVNNSPQGVFIEVEGKPEKLTEFLLRIEKNKPPRSVIQSLESLFLDPVGYKDFVIKPSSQTGIKTALVLPDIATCADCIKEIFDPTNRRYHYPFTNCTNCGPRFSIIESLPYDRANTTMKKFKMCDLCQAEYENPLDRRFHAQPNACPVCGPHLELWNRQGKTLSSHYPALLKACQAIRQGKIVAVKGLGGFHLIVDARNELAVIRLRRLKNREEKPFALMYPSLEMIKKHCQVTELEARLLLSPESPIVLLKKRLTDVSPMVAKDNPYFGVMLPYTPLHYLLMTELGFPVVATSGNLSDEPICTDEYEAIKRLSSIADLFLVHNRPIARHVDDSIVRVVLGRELVLRRARGYAPLPVHLPKAQIPNKIPTVLAVGAHFKNAIALSIDRAVFISQHIGDLDTSPAMVAFEKVVKSFERLYEQRPDKIVCDLHPDYLSTRFAEKSGLPLIRIQHHLAHTLSVMAENELFGPVLSVSWDGTGYGLDDTIWGGEFLLVNPPTYQRIGSFRTFRLPGSEIAIREPRRSALGILYEIFGDKVWTMKEIPTLKAFLAKELSLIKTMLRQNINSPITSSIGRIFDAVSSITGLCQKMRFEGQAAMKLEFALDGIKTDQYYPFQILSAQSPTFIIDWKPMILAILKDMQNETQINKISAKFHNTLIEIIIKVAKRIGKEKVVLTGGCFQNKYLTERAVINLTKAGFRPYWHQRVPPNDGGIALGQIVAGLFQTEATES